jgi:glycosyltransferase involved in cell wall biosynthesis
MNRVKRFLLKTALRHADLVVSQNRVQKEQYERQYGKSSVVIYNMVEDIPEIDVKDYKKEYFLWVGRYVDVKRFELYVELARRLPEIRFVAITNAEKKDIPSNLEILPLMKREELYGYYRGAVMLVNTSKWEGFPNVYLESWANGTGVITLKIDPDDIIERNDIGYICNEDMDMMEERIKYLWNNRDEAYKMGKRAREYVKENHSTEAIEKKWLEVLEKL